MAVKSWTAGVSGTWGNGVNWSPIGLPGAADDAIVNGPATGFDAISGNGVTATMTFVGGTRLSGAFATSGLTVGNTVTAGALSLTGGSLVALGANVVFGPVLVSGAGTKLSVTGQLAMGGPRTGAGLTANSLVVSSGAIAQLGGVLMQATPGGNGITVQDSLSAVEIGTAGGAAAGRITVDASRLVSGQGSLIAPGGVVNQGTIVADGGVLAIGGGVTGSGQLQIGSHATLYLMNGASSDGVIFTGAGGTLELTLNGTAGLTQTGTITGFLPGDLIWFASGVTVTGVAYRAGASGLGTLTLSNGAATVGTLVLAGNYTGYVFQATANPTYGTNLVAVQVGSTGGTATGGSPGTDGFAWIASSGSWAAATNWQDTTTLANGVAAPGFANAVTIAGPSGTVWQTITGPGQAASITATGNTVLTGVFGADSLQLGQRGNPGQLVLSASALTVGGATVAAGGITAIGSTAHLAVTGALALGSPTGASTPSAQTLRLGSGATAQVDSLTLNPSLGGNSVSVDSASSLEIGSVGDAGLGLVTIDAGHSIGGAGLVLASGGVVNQGTITARGGTLQIGAAVTGGGQLAIGSGATLSLYGGVSTEPVSFAGTTATLQLTLTLAGGLTSTGAISSFLPGDTIYLASSTPVTSVSYGAGTLTLNNGGTVIGALPLLGNFIGTKFQVAAQSYGTAITVVPQFPSADKLFDPIFYIQTYPDVASSGMDPYQHYMTIGWREGRDPSAYFHTSFYLSQNPDVAASGINPLTHYAQYGWREGRDGSLAFSTNGYLSANPDVRSAGLDPLLHFLTDGKAEGRAAVPATPHPVGTADPGVDYAWYYAQHPDVATAGMDASFHYHQYGWKGGYNPNPYFDSNFYLTQNPDVAAARVDPLTHYETTGWREARTPSLTFSGNSYLANNPDIAAAGMDPLLHFLHYGLAEGRSGALAGAGTVADPLIDVAYLGRQLGATLLPAGAAGQQELTALYDNALWQRGLNPDAWFDTAYYLAHNPDVAAAGVNPLLQYETTGWQEGRDPSAQFSTARYLLAYSSTIGNVDPLQDFIVSGQAAGRTAFAV